MAIRKRRRLSPTKRFPLRPWEVKYVKAIGPKVDTLTREIVNELIKRGIPQKFLDYLNHEYRSKGIAKLAFDTTADAAKLDDLARGVLSAVTWDADKAVADMTGDIFQASSRQAFGKMGIEAVWKLDSPAVAKAIKARQNQIANVTETQFSAVKSLLRQQCYEQGESPVDARFLERLRSAAGKSSRYEAERIARTETLTVQTKAAKTVYSENGVSRKGWLYSGSGYERHEGLAGEEVAMDEPFSNGLQHPGDEAGEPGEIINCKCDFYPVMASGFDLDPEDVVNE